MLLCGSIVAAAAAVPQAFVILREDLDGVVAPVRVEIGGLVRKRVLAAKFVLNLDECVGDISNLEWEESPPTGGICDSLKDRIPTSSGAGHVSTDGVDNNFSPLRHFD